MGRRIEGRTGVILRERKKDAVLLMSFVAVAGPGTGGAVEGGVLEWQMANGSPQNGR
jgi:hypothetical protein